MKRTDAILIVGFLFLGIVTWFGFQSVAKNSPKTEFEACMEQFAKFNDNPDGVAKINALITCSGGRR